MFDQHNILTKASYWLLAVNSIVGLIYVGYIARPLIDNQGFVFSGDLFFFFILIMLNTFLAFRVYNHSRQALMFCLFFYAIQIIGIKSRLITFYISAGMDVSLYFHLGTTMISIHFVPLFIFIVILFALKSIKKTGDQLG